MKKYQLFFIGWIMASCSGSNNTSDAYGNFESDEVLVSSEVAGKIIDYRIEKGMKLETGEFAGLIDTIPIYLKKEQLQAQLKTIYSKLVNLDAQAQVHRDQIEILEKETHRFTQLFEQGAATEKQRDDLEGNLQVSKSQLNAVLVQKETVRAEVQLIRSQIEEINDRIGRCKLKNPVAGTVLETYAREGELAIQGKPLYKIANLEEIELKAYVGGSQLSQVKIGQTVKVLFDQSEKEIAELPGEVIWISSQAEFTPKIIQTKDERVNMVYAIKVKVKNDGRMKIGMPGEVRFEPNEKAKK